MREYEAVLDKMGHARSDITRAETLYPLAIAAIYAWIFATPPAIAVLWRIALYLPVGIAALGIIRLYSRRKHMALLEAYVLDLESEIYGDDAELGWERRYAREKPLAFMIYVRAAYSLAILAGTIWIACHADTLFLEWQASKPAP